MKLSSKSRLVSSRIDEQPTGTPPVEDGGDDVEMEQQLQLQSAPTFSAQLLQQSIAAMKTLLQQQSMRAAGPARKAVITVSGKWKWDFSVFAHGEFLPDHSHWS